MKVCIACGNRFAADDWVCPACDTAPKFEHGYPMFAPHLAQEADSFKAELFEQANKLEAGNYWFEARDRLLTWVLGKYFPNARSFLDIGCGTGFVLSNIKRQFPGISLHGSDIFIDALACTRERVPDGDLFQMDARRIPFDDEFDVVGAFDVLEHITEDDVVLSQMFQAVKKGGGAIIIVPQHGFLWSVHDDYLCHKRRYSRREIFEKARNAGFEIIRATSFISLLLPLMLASRAARRQSADNYDPYAALRTGDFTNACLKKGLGLERFLIKMGVSFPAGGSLLLVAKRSPA